MCCVYPLPGRSSKTRLRRRASTCAYLGVVIGSLVCFLLLPGCDSNEVEEQEALAGTIWQWKTFEVDGQRRQIEFGHSSSFPPEQQYVLFFREPYVSNEQKIWSLAGILDCNQIDGGYAYDTDGTLSIHTVSVTAEGCGGGMEGLFLEALQGATRYEMQRDTLRIYAQGGPFLEGKPVTLVLARTVFPGQAR